MPFRIGQMRPRRTDFLRQQYFPPAAVQNTRLTMRDQRQRYRWSGTVRLQKDSLSASWIRRGLLTVEFTAPNPFGDVIVPDEFTVAKAKSFAGMPYCV